MALKEVNAKEDFDDAFVLAKDAANKASAEDLLMELDTNETDVQAPLIFILDKFIFKLQIQGLLKLPKIADNSKTKFRHQKLSLMGCLE